MRLPVPFCWAGMFASTPLQKAMDLVKSFIAQITGEHHAVINVMLREENRLFSDERRQAIFQLIAAFRQGLT
jgi:hypothetical protein